MSLSRSAQRKIDKLAELLIRAQAAGDPNPVQLDKFQRQYDGLTRDEQPWFFDALIRRMEIRKEDIEGPLRALLASNQENAIHWSRLVTELRRAMESPRMRAFRRFLNVSGGFKFLLDLRSDVITAGRQSSLDLDPLVEDTFTEKARQSLMDYYSQKTRRSPFDFRSVLLEILSSPSWIEDPDLIAHIQKPLIEITHFYVTREQNHQGKPLNPVANFHMGNGATTTRKNINFGANRSERGLADSCGMMVNYVYSRTWLQQIGRTMQSWLPWNV